MVSYLSNDFKWKYELEQQIQAVTAVSLNVRGMSGLTAKVLNRLREAKNSNLRPSEKAQSLVKHCDKITEQTCDLVNQAGLIFYSSTSEEKEDLVAFNSSTEALMPKLSTTTSRSDCLAPLTSLSCHIASLSNDLHEFWITCQEPGSFAKINHTPAPWCMRATAVKKNKLLSTANEHELNRLRAIVSDATKQLLNRESALDEAYVKIELFESRIRESNLKSARISELDMAANKYRRKVEDLVSDIDRYKADVASLAAERDQLRLSLQTRDQDYHLEDDNDSGQRASLLSVELEKLAPLQAENELLCSALRFAHKDCLQNIPLTALYSLKKAERCLFTPLRIIHAKENTVIHRNFSFCNLGSLVSGRKAAKRADLYGMRTSKMIPNITMLPSPIDLSLYMERRTRLHWRPIRYTPIWNISQEEEKLIRWFEKFSIL